MSLFLASYIFFLSSSHVAEISILAKEEACVRDLSPSQLCGKHAMVAISYNPHSRESNSLSNEK